MLEYWKIELENYIKFEVSDRASPVAVEDKINMLEKERQSSWLWKILKLFWNRSDSVSNLVPGLDF